ncbi:thioesterase family protein [Mycobacterium sp. SMC-4]|uniref:thioesterase family protein n=1 Tax=Mycobacterium sp. SMC-4 TaxID=2857059 RepID=UPI0021B3227A|nr:thioesterase family protein [Mycobacterium sp. SMC-4]UXA18221.1 thioesterase family protein [Mycobacterium sp. SMC-4]
MSSRAFFDVDGEDFVPTSWARGPWGQMVSGNYAGGLLGYAVDNAVTDTELHPARLTVDLLRPVAMAPVQLQTSVRRSGRRLHLLDASMTQNGVEVARAGALYLRRGEQPSGDRWTTPITMPPLPPDPDPIEADVTTLVWTFGNDGDRPSRGLGGWAHAGPKYMWVRDLVPLVDGVELTPFTRAAMAGDMASSLTHFGADGLPFINADYTLTLSRLPRSEYLGLAALTHHSDDGVATGTAVLVDTDGPIGTATATALANPGFTPAGGIG